MFGKPINDSYNITIEALQQIIWMVLIFSVWSSLLVHYPVRLTRESELNYAWTDVHVCFFLNRLSLSGGYMSVFRPLRSWPLFYV